jgi:hypothetical protein
MTGARARRVPPMPGPGRRETAVRERFWIDVSRSILVTLVTMLLLSGCGAGESAAGAPLTPPDDVSGLDDAEQPGAGFVAPAVIPVETYEGSGQLVHPDAAVFPARWQGKRYWVAGTPYPGGNPKFENPSIYQGRFSREMRVPSGVTNPLVSAPTSGYMSDPDMLHDPDSGELRMYYRETMGGMDAILLITSADGVHWSPSRLVATDVRYSLISPAIVRESATSWRMWTVNAQVQGCTSLEGETTLQQRRSSDGITWGAPEPVMLLVPGRVPWHWDVQYVAAKQEYWALLAAYPDGTTCSRTALYFARSADGTAWNVAPMPLLAPGEFDPLRDLVYRSSFYYHEGSDAVSVWFSGARLEGNAFRYAVASARYPYPELLRRVGSAPAIIPDRDAARESSGEIRAARVQFESAFP